jgi:hypothetical protein
MRYKGLVKCSSKGYPVCCQDDEYCTVAICHYYADMANLGNCMLRVDREYTLEEIGKMMNLTRERVRQIEEKAVEKVRREIIKMEG